MIKKIDIEKFGLFDKYVWDLEIGKQESFQRLNIIYGRNYTGKTTLARIFKCVENTILHKDYMNCGFSLTLSDGSVLTQDHFKTDIRPRVYNVDFVKENLSWLHNMDGTILPFTILGAKNVELVKKIKEIEDILGTVEDKKGLLHQILETSDKLGKAKAAFINAEKGLEDKLRKRANDKIKVDPSLFIASQLKKTYTISDIKHDIELIEKDMRKFILPDEILNEKRKLLREGFMANITALPEAKPNFQKYYEQTNQLLGRKITPSEPIVELINESLLQEWVRQGIVYHKDKRETCGFCGSPLPAYLWSKLDAHFSKESEMLRTELIALVNLLDHAKKALPGFLTLTKELFYKSLGSKFENILKEWNLTIKTYENNLDSLITAIEDRQHDVFKEKKLEEIQDISEDLTKIMSDFNKLIAQHNAKTSSLLTDQQNARNELRYADIAQYLTDIEYGKELEKIRSLQHQELNLQLKLKPLQEQLETLLEDKSHLEAQAKDESKGAELVNQHLNHFFGHNELKLKAEGQTPNMKFVIHRDNSIASNLSEGECSLISFCYFLARMEDELKDELYNHKLVIYIDDPISSLDSNHIFFMFSLIESIIAKPKKYGQLFISTHNLDFLKYLKKLTVPKYKPQLGANDKLDIKHFIIERKNKKNILLKLAPDYLKNYITEFNNLFNQIYQCSIADVKDIPHDHQYNFGNNVRKFLEAYLFYKYLSHKLTFDQRQEKFFDDDKITMNLIRRLFNEYSHLGEQFDRGLEPIDVDEMKKVAIGVLQKIKEADADQYEALMESCNLTA